MKKFTKGCAVDLRGQSNISRNAIFRKLGVDFSCMKDGLYVHDYLINNADEEVFVGNVRGNNTLLTPIDILGRELVKALEDGYTPWFEGDNKSVGAVNWLLSGGSKFAYKPIEQPSIESKILTAKVGAPEILQSALGHMQDRAKTYDKPTGERSIDKAVSMFNILYSKDLTSEQGWAFMCLLKMVRSSQGEFKLDNYEDLAAYSGLMGESALEMMREDDAVK